MEITGDRIREEGDLDWETGGEGLSKADMGETSGKDSCCHLL